MFTATKTVVNSQTSSLEFLAKASKTDFSSKVTSEVEKTYNNKVVSKSKSEDFKDVLSSKANSKDEDIQKINSSDNQTKQDDVTKVDELKENLKKLKENLKELEEDDKPISKDEVEDILTQLLNLLTKLGVKEEDLKSNGEINSEALKNLIKGLNENKSSNNVNSIMEKLMELMKKDSVKNSLDTDSLKSIEKILGNLSANLTKDNTEVKSGIKNLMTEVSNILEKKQNQNGKILTLEDMLNKNYSQDNDESSLGSDSKGTTSEAPKSKETSKEDKFLNSLLDDNKDSSLNKINLFASRTQVTQNQSGDAVRGLTINKATFANDLIRDVKFMSTNTMKELIVKVNPGDLGEITIKLIQEDGVMKANLKANSKEATALLAQNLVEMKKQLSEQNIKIADVNIELYQDDTTFFSEQGFGGQLSEEQRKGNNNRNNSVSNVMSTEEEINDNNIPSIANNFESFA